MIKKPSNYYRPAQPQDQFGEAQEQYPDQKLTPKRTKEAGFITVADPNIRKNLMDITKCPGDATNFTFWYTKSEPFHWGLTIKSIPKKGYQSQYELDHGMNFNSQHTWKITWYYDQNMLKVANHSKSLAKDILGQDFDSINKIYTMYRETK